MGDITEYTIQNHFEEFRPGPQGPVGGVFMSTQMKRSSPDSSLRWDPRNSGINEIYFGSNVQDGGVASFTTGGGPGKVIEVPYRKKLQIGDSYQSVIPPDKLIIPVMGEIKNLEEAAQKIEIHNARRLGNLFPTRPFNSYGARVVDLSGPDAIATPTGTIQAPRRGLGP